MGKIINRVRERQAALGRKERERRELQRHLRAMTAISTAYRPGKWVKWEAGAMLAILVAAMVFAVYVAVRG